MEEITFENSAGQELKGILSDPGDAELCVVMCHGLGSSKESTTCEILTGLLNDEGIATFRFDFHGHGESEGNFEDVLPSRGVRDALHAVAFMKESYDRLALFGSSFGGYAAYQAAAKTPHLAALALKCPVADFTSLDHASMVDGSLEEWKERGYADWYGRRLNWSYVEDCMQADASHELGHIDCPTLIVHGSADDIVPVQQSREASEEIRKCTLLTIKGADHRFSEEGQFNEMITAISEFLVNAG